MDVTRERDKLRAHLALTSMRYRGHLHLIPSSKHRTRSSPMHAQQGRVNRNSSMDQARKSEKQDPPPPHKFLQTRLSTSSRLVLLRLRQWHRVRWDTVSEAKLRSNWFGGQMKNLHPCLFAPLILSVVEIQTRLALLITFLLCWFTPQQILLLWKSNMASEESVQSDWNQLLFPEFKK